MLITFLEFKTDEKFNFKDFVKYSKDEYRKGCGKISIEKIYDSSRFDINKAKAVICQDGDKIFVYEVKEAVLKDLEGNRAISIRPKYSWKQKTNNMENKKQSKRRFKCKKYYNFREKLPEKLLTNLPQEVIDLHKNMSK